MEWLVARGDGGRGEALLQMFWNNESREECLQRRQLAALRILARCELVLKRW